MPCSPEKLAANRRNCRKSTGPKTPEGKEKSRRNGLKHGLTGAGVVIPDEDAGAVEGRFEAFEADLKPRNDVARFLVERAAFLSVRLERSARQESAKLAKDMIEAGHAEEDARLEEVARLVDLVATKPVEAVRKLRRSPEGIDRLIDAWRKLKLDLIEGKSGRWESQAPQRLAGREPAYNRLSRFAALTKAMRGDFEWLDATDWPDLPGQERQDAARGELARMIDAEVAGLEQARRDLDHESIARVREGAAARAIFDASKDAALARKYEAAAERGFFRTLEQIEQVNATAEEPDKADASPSEAADSAEVASSFPGERKSPRPIPPASQGSGGDTNGGLNRPRFGDFEVQTCAHRGEIDREMVTARP